MASRQEKDSLFQDVFRYVEDAYQTDGREAAWYLPYGHIFSDAFRRRSRVLKRLAFGAQQEFCMDSEIAQNDPVFQITRQWVTRSGNTGNESVEGNFLSLSDHPESDDAEMNLTSIDLTDIFDPSSREASRDTHRVPDFVGFFRKAKSKKDFPNAPNLPWMIVEVKPPHVLLSSGQFASDDFGEEAKTNAHIQMLAARQQVINQIEYAFHEHRGSITKLVVVIAIGPFFEFFVARRLGQPGVQGQGIQLRSLDTNIVFHNASSINAKSLFDEGVGMINPKFYTLFNKACREFGL